MFKSPFSKTEDKTKTLQQAELSVICKPYEDIQSENIKFLVRDSPGNYIVFVDADLELDYETTADYDESHAECKEELDSTYSSLEEIEFSPAAQYLSRNRKIALARLLGIALASQLDGSKEAAAKSIQTAETYMKERTAEISRRWLLMYSFFATAVGCLIWKFLLPEDFILFGCLGALFSILCKAGKLEYDCRAGRGLNVLETVSRFLTAVISAYLAEQLYQMDLLFTAFKSTDNSSAVLLLICFVAGFSERLVPSVVSHLGSTQEKESGKSDT